MAIHDATGSNKTTIHKKENQTAIDDSNKMPGYIRTKSTAKTGEATDKKEERKRQRFKENQVIQSIQSIIARQQWKNKRRKGRDSPAGKKSSKRSIINMAKRRSITPGIKRERETRGVGPGDRQTAKVTGGCPHKIIKRVTSAVGFMKRGYGGCMSVQEEKERCQAFLRIGGNENAGSQSWRMQDMQDR